MTDYFGNYVAELLRSTIPAISVPRVPEGRTGSGAGAPTANTPLFYFTWVNTTNGDVYWNKDGTAAGWVKQN